MSTVGSFVKWSDVKNAIREADPKSTWDTPRFVRGYDITLDDRLVLPRGPRHTVTAIVETAGSRLAITDTRNAGSEIEV